MAERVTQSEWDAARKEVKAKAAKTIKANADKALKALAKRRKAAGYPVVEPAKVVKDASEVEETEEDTDTEATEAEAEAEAETN